MIETTVLGQALRFSTRKGLFSPQKIDQGTLAMLSHVTFSATDKVLDLGCGYGVVGILAAKFTSPDLVYLCDSDPLAIESASINAKLNDVEGVHLSVSDGFHAFTVSEFNLILSNPPYHADFSVPKHFIEKGFNRLVIGGSMYMVTKRDRWYQQKLRAIFGGVQMWEENGYFVFRAVKKTRDYAGKSKSPR